MTINPDIGLRINARKENFLIIEPGSRNLAVNFQKHLNLGYLTLDDYMWLNSWCDTNKCGAGSRAICPLESDIFGFELGEKLKGMKDGKPVSKTPQEIINMFIEKSNREFQIK